MNIIYQPSPETEHNCKNIRQHVKTGGLNTLSATSAQFTTTKIQCCADV